ncbi:MAG: tetratricopeptide repeat protein [Candidatus Scalinduaceae bacterium]
MKRLLIFQILFVSFLQISFDVPAYGESKFSQHYNKAIEYYKQGKYDQARVKFEKALESKPNDAYALYGLGNTHYCNANYDEAIKIYTKAIKINPNYPKLHYSLSLAYSKMGMTSNAEKEKEIFRELTQGGKRVGKAPTRAKSSQTRKESKEAVGEVKKDRIVETEKESILRKKKRTEALVKLGERDASQALVKQRGKRQQERVVKEIQRMPVTKKGAKTEEAQTVFKGYTQETAKAKPRVYVKKYQETYSLKSKPLMYIKESWNKSSINKILICTLSYVFATQMWLCAVAFFGVIIWRIRKQTE